MPDTSTIPLDLYAVDQTGYGLTTEDAGTEERQHQGKPKEGIPDREQQQPAATVEGHEGGGRGRGSLANNPRPTRVRGCVRPESKGGSLRREGPAVSKNRNRKNKHAEIKNALKNQEKTRQRDPKKNCPRMRPKIKCP